MTVEIISLGAGVQSTTLFLMACRGELMPRPAAAVFADTQWEPPHVYENLAFLAQQGERADIPVIRATAGNIRANTLAGYLRGSRADSERSISLPFYARNADGQIGMVRRQCTQEYKIRVIEKAIRAFLGIAHGQRVAPNMVRQWIGITCDEASRMKDSRARWYSLHYPLIFDCDPPMSRADCVAWLTRNKYPVPQKSACIGCPFHSAAEWRYIKSDPALWADACEFDEAIRNKSGMHAQLFLHRSGIPLREVDLSTPEDRGQLNWIHECEGMCGV